MLYKKHAAVISLVVFTLGMITVAMPQMKFANSQKAETLDFVVTVKNIEHKNVLVQLRITGGESQNFTIQGLPKYIDAPNQQLVKFTFPRQSTTPGILPLKIGDEYFPCVSYQGSEAACLRATIDSLTIAQAKTVDVKAIPS